MWKYHRKSFESLSIESLTLRNVPKWLQGDDVSTFQSDLTRRATEANTPTTVIFLCHDVVSTYIRSERSLQTWDMCLRPWCCTQKLWGCTNFLHNVALKNAILCLWSLFKDGIEKLSCTDRPTNTLFVLIFSWEVLPIIKTQNKCRPSTGRKQACIFNYHLLRIL